MENSDRMKINANDVKRMADEVGEELTEDQAKRIINRVGKNGILNPKINNISNSVRLTHEGKKLVIEGLDFEENTLSTVGSNKSETKYKLEDGKEIKLFLFDTAGQERFRSIALKSVKNSQGVMLVFDVTNKKSFESLVKWLEDIKEEDNNFSMILFGNKCDLPNREVSEEEAENFAKKIIFLIWKQVQN